MGLTSPPVHYQDQDEDEWPLADDLRRRIDSGDSRVKRHAREHVTGDVSDLSRCVRNCSSTSRTGDGAMG